MRLKHKKRRHHRPPTERRSSPTGQATLQQQTNGNSIGQLRDSIAADNILRAMKGLEWYNRVNSTTTTSTTGSATTSISTPMFSTSSIRTLLHELIAKAYKNV